MNGVVIRAVQQTGTDSNTDSDWTQKINYILNGIDGNNPNGGSGVVGLIRGAISKGNRTPLSATPNSVPPEGVRYALALAVQELVASTPNMGWSIKDGFDLLIGKAEAWLESLGRGEPTDYPTDPITTDASGYQVADGGNSGEICGQVWLGTDELVTLPIYPVIPVGGTKYSGYQNPNGFQVGNVGDQYWQYNQNDGGQLSQIWVKTGTSGNNTGWTDALL